MVGQNCPRMMNDVIAGKTAAVRKTVKKRGVSVLRGGPGTASKGVGLTGSMLTYAVSMGIIEHSVAHGIRKPKDQVRDRRLSEEKYRGLGKALKAVSDDPELAPTIAIIRLPALTGCRRGEINSLKWSDVDFENSCLRLSDSKERASVRPIGLPVIELLEQLQEGAAAEAVFPGTRGGEFLAAFPINVRGSCDNADGYGCRGRFQHLWPRLFGHVGALVVCLALGSEWFARHPV
ncbi:MAG: tyrosine-type recombinase/integrase [Pseudomonadota bacterium]